MKKRRGTILFSVIIFLAIFGTFESQRYISFQQRENLYELILKTYREPAPAAVQKGTKSAGQPHEKQVSSAKSASIKFTSES
ncbi:hypothetical protein [Lactiplantibacillus fabifermentans]|uniref:Uncharacterized protein n=1 Tax=Lactiplantibacillus fabifermentans DSM 21115 TaxID=1413187 RepID=A0A0R2NJ54_9LACO|nr:hypothetical protein [Lactiplantibacillus fabifermentans]KRO25823.1 hypothetical protein DY78_GL001125 [Lactiplantibacillus fabifermentans DSM 21115]